MGIPNMDMVLNGDIVDMLELLGRGSRLSPQHNAFWGTLAGANKMGDSIFYLRGNHDFVIPPVNFFKKGIRYRNTTLETLAEHGDRYDPTNFPPGLNNFGSKLVVRLVAQAENFFTLIPGFKNGGIYDLAGLDNLQPLTRKELRAFLLTRFRRGGGLIRLLAAFAQFGGFNKADDSKGYRGALKLAAQQPPPKVNRSWLTVFGHTHVPIAVPNVHYNTASWLPALIKASKKNESLLDFVTFLLVYADPQTGKRIEEFYGAFFATCNNPVLVRFKPGVVNMIRSQMGYKPLP